MVNNNNKAKIKTKVSGSYTLQERSPWLSGLEILHSYLMLVLPYVLVASATGQQGMDWWKYILCSLTILGASALSFIMVRKIRNYALCLTLALAYMLASVALAWYVGQGLTVKNAETDALAGLAQILLMFLTLVLNILVFAVRIKSRIEQSQLQQDFEAQHEGEKNVLLNSWETKTFLNQPSPIHWIWNIILYIPAVLMSYRACYRFMFGIMLADLLVCFLHYYMNSFQNYIKNHHRMANMPLAMMKKVNKLLLGVGLALFLAAVLPALAYHREPLEGWRPKVHVTMEPVLLEEPVQEQAAMQGDNIFEELMSEEDSWTPPAWMLWLMNAMAYALFAVAVVGILLAIWNKLREAGRDFAVGDEDEVIFLDDVVEDQGEILYGQARPKDGFLSQNARIRRRYRKAIQKGTKGLPDSSATPSQLEQEAGWKGSPEEIELHQLYEKARYGK